MAILARDVAIDETRAVEIPDVHYARSGDIAIAYQIVGDGHPDIIFVRAIAGDLLSTWEQPLLVRQLDVFASCGRLLFGASSSSTREQRERSRRTILGHRRTKSGVTASPPFAATGENDGSWRISPGNGPPKSQGTTPFVGGSYGTCGGVSVPAPQ